MNNVFAHPRDFAPTELQLRADPEADEHCPLDPLAVPLVSELHAEGPAHRHRGVHPIPFPDLEALTRRREAAARLERLRQVAADLDQAGRAEREKGIARAAFERGFKAGHDIRRAQFRNEPFYWLAIGAFAGSLLMGIALQLGRHAGAGL